MSAKLIGSAWIAVIISGAGCRRASSGPNLRLRGGSTPDERAICGQRGLPNLIERWLARLPRRSRNQRGSAENRGPHPSGPPRVRSESNLHPGPTGRGDRTILLSRFDRVRALMGRGLPLPDVQRPRRLANYRPSDACRSMHNFADQRDLDETRRSTQKTRRSTCRPPAAP